MKKCMMIRIERGGLSKDMLLSVYSLPVMGVFSINF